MKMISLAQLSSLVAKGFDGDESSVTLISRQLKNLVSKGILEPSEQRGGRRDAYFDERAI